VVTICLYYDAAVSIALTIILSFVVPLIADDMRSTGHSPRNHHTSGG
jgi:hypothetical protein